MRKGGLRAAVLATSLLLALPATGKASPTVSTLGAWNGHSAVEGFGDPETATYGQVVTVPAGQDAINSFTFYLDQPTSIAFHPYIYAWGGKTATGSPLYEGPQMHTSEEGAYQAVTAETGGIPVMAGHQYVLFFSISNDEVADKGLGLEGPSGGRSTARGLPRR